jgi:hypothetical protein
MWFISSRYSVHILNFRIIIVIVTNDETEVPHIYNTVHTANDCIPIASAPNASIRTHITQKSYQPDLITPEYCAAL